MNQQYRYVKLSRLLAQHPARRCRSKWSNDQCKHETWNRWLGSFNCRTLVYWEWTMPTAQSLIERR